MSYKPNNSSLPTSQRPKLKAKKKEKQEEKGSSANAMPEKSSSSNRHSERTIEIYADATFSGYWQQKSLSWTGITWWIRSVLAYRRP
jgi:hypothetical protein